VPNGQEPLDQLDRQIAVALQVNGRASWRAVGRALGVPERTVTRRGQALLDAGLVKVSTYVDTTRVGKARPLIVVAHTEPGRSVEIGHELAKRPDASSVSVLEGTGDLVCMLLPADERARYQLLLHDLPSLEGLRDTSVATVLRYFRSGYDWVAEGLGADALAELQTLPRSDPERIDAVELDAEDRLLVDELARDGRSPVSSLAQAIGMSPSSVQRRLNRLFAEGAIHIRTEIRPHLLGLHVEVLVWMRVVPSEIDPVGRTLSAHPAVRFCAATTGTTQILIDCLCRDENELYEFVTGYLGAKPSSEVVNVGVVIAALRRGPLVVADPFT
jgi:DNA-binding Lrp family transcriptional regulator